MNDKRTQGFTLLELMITVAIIAILTAIAVPAYNNYVTTARLGEAKNNLMQLQTLMEQYFQDNRTYDIGGVGSISGTDNIKTALTGWKPGATADLKFTYNIPSMSATAYTISAVGTGSVSGYTFGIDQNNNRTLSGGSSATW